MCMLCRVSRVTFIGAVTFYLLTCIGFPWMHGDKYRSVGVSVELCVVCVLGWFFFLPCLRPTLQMLSRRALSVQTSSEITYQNIDTVTKPL